MCCKLFGKHGRHALDGVFAGVHVHCLALSITKTSPPTPRSKLNPGVSWEAGVSRAMAYHPGTEPDLAIRLLYAVDTLRSSFDAAIVAESARLALP